MSIFIRRFLLLCGVLAISIAPLFADGEYQRTKDGKTTIWNNEPKAGDEATWSGDRDGEGYGRGFGTLTWYNGDKRKRFGITVPESNIYARYFGFMVRGKFNGEVNVHTKGKTDHASFADGKRTTRWRPGRAATRSVDLASIRRTEKEKAEPEAPAEGPRVVRQTKKAEPPPAQDRQVKAESSDRVTAAATPASSPEVKRPPAQQIQKPPPQTALAKKSQAEVEESLQSLVGPPSSLHAIPDATPSEQMNSNPRLTSEEVVDLADAEARTRGVSPGEYRRAGPQFNSRDRVWSLSYDQEASEGSDQPTKHFSVTIDDKTKGIVFVQGK